jgi:hypothetical protein
MRNDSGSGSPWGVVRLHMNAETPHNFTAEDSMHLGDALMQGRLCILNTKKLAHVQNE